MFQSQEKSTGTQYTTTVALVLAAFVFIPALLVASLPVHYSTLGIAVIASTASVILAWFSWKKNSDLTMPSLETAVARAK